MYVILEAGGHQWKVEPGTQLKINRVTTKVGAEHTFDRVLMAHDGERLQIGRPYLPGAKVVCEVLSHDLGKKVISYYFRRRENWRKTIGHRQPLTRVMVKDIQIDSRSAKAKTQKPTSADAIKPSASVTARARPTSVNVAGATSAQSATKPTKPKSGSK
jgi:large subunit ribosomal protein L21